MPSLRALSSKADLSPLLSVKPGILRKAWSRLPRKVHTRDPNPVSGRRRPRSQPRRTVHAGRFTTPRTAPSARRHLLGALPTPAPAPRRRAPAPPPGPAHGRAAPRPRPSRPRPRPSPLPPQRPTPRFLPTLRGAVNTGARTRAGRRERRGGVRAGRAHADGAVHGSGGGGGGHLSSQRLLWLRVRGPRPPLALGLGRSGGEAWMRGAAVAEGRPLCRHPPTQGRPSGQHTGGRGVPARRGLVPAGALPRRPLAARALWVGPPDGIGFKDV